MSGHRIAAITRRLLQQFRRDRRTLALLFVAPLVILGLLGYLIRGSSSSPAVGIANEDQGPLGGTFASALERSSLITASTIQASDGDAKLKDGSLVAYIVFPSDFSLRAQAGTIAPKVHLEGSQPGTSAPVLQALQQALTSAAATGPSTSPRLSSSTARATSLASSAAAARAPASEFAKRCAPSSIPISPPGNTNRRESWLIRRH